MSDVKDKYLLRTKDGKFLTVKNEELCAVERQSPRKNGQGWMLKSEAFYFPETKKGLVWTVDSGKLKVIKKTDTVNATASYFYFKKEDVGSSEHYGLRVSPPNLYICQGKGRSNALELTSDRQQCVLVTHEKI